MSKDFHQQQPEFEEKVIRISRVSKKTKGGDQMGFTALMVVGDRKGKVGVGLGKAKDVVNAIKKGIRQAKKKMVQIPIDGTTIPFKIVAKHGGGRVLLKPATKGSGVIAGGPVRAVVEAAGIKDISAKILGSDNQASSVYATFKALKKIKKIVKVRGIQFSQETDKQEKNEKKDGQSSASSSTSAKSTKKSGNTSKKKKIQKKGIKTKKGVKDKKKTEKDKTAKKEDKKKIKKTKDNKEQKNARDKSLKKG